MVADGAAFGSEMEKLMRVIKNYPNVTLYLPESFESQEGTFPDACIATNFSLNENGDIM